MIGAATLNGAIHAFAYQLHPNIKAPPDDGGDLGAYGPLNVDLLRRDPTREMDTAARWL
jgi:hypothetical protein